MLRNFRRRFPVSKMRYAFPTNEINRIKLKKGCADTVRCRPPSDSLCEVVLLPAEVPLAANDPAARVPSRSASQPLVDPALVGFEA